MMNYVIICKKTGAWKRQATEQEKRQYHDEQSNPLHHEHKARFPYAFTAPVDLNQDELIDAFLIKGQDY